MRRAGGDARLIWPHVLCVLRRCGGVATGEDLHPEALADLVGGDQEQWQRGLDGLRRVGLLVAVEREIRRGRGTRTKRGWGVEEEAWADYQPDGRPRGASRKRPNGPRDETGQPVGPTLTRARAPAPSSPVKSSPVQSDLERMTREAWSRYVADRSHQRPSPGKEAREKIAGRLRQGFSVEDLVAVSHWVLRSREDYPERMRAKGYTTYTTIWKERGMADRVDKARAWARRREALAEYAAPSLDLPGNGPLVAVTEGDQPVCSGCGQRVPVFHSVSLGVVARALCVRCPGGAEQR